MIGAILPYAAFGQSSEKVIQPSIGGMIPGNRSRLSGIIHDVSKIFYFTKNEIFPIGIGGGRNAVSRHHHELTRTEK